MIKHEKSWEYIVLLNDNFPREVNEIRSEFSNILPPSNVVTFRSPVNSASFLGVTDRTRAAEVLREVYVEALNPDFVHLASLFEGLHDDVVTSVDALNRGVPTAVTLYDLIPFNQRELYLSHYSARAHYFEKVRQLEKASLLLAISQFSADEARKGLLHYTGDIVNIRGGVDPKFKKLSFAASWDDPRLRYGISKRFILYTASFDVRKNQIGLIKAFAKLAPRFRERYQLVFVGHSSQETFNELLSQASHVGLSEGDVRFLGRVPDDDLVLLYNLCELFVFPPKWEGLGLPVLEAMACGAPAIGSASTAVAEVVGREDALFDPNDVDSISKKLSQALEDSAFRAELKAHAAQHVKQYTWDRSAAEANAALAASAARFQRLTGHSNGQMRSMDQVSLATAFGEHLHPEALVESDLRKICQCAAANELYSTQPVPAGRPRQAWVTTWATRCGIAAYSEGFYDSGLFDAVILAPYLDSPRSVESGNVVRCWRQGKEDTLLDLERALDDADVNEVIIQFNYGFFDFHALSSLVMRQVWRGRKVFIFLHSTTDPEGDPSSRLAILQDALAQCCAVFVHSVIDLGRLSDLGVSSNVVLLPFYIPPSKMPVEFSRAGLRKIATYGFFLPGKGLMEVVEALDITRRSGSNFDLMMLNAEYTSQELSGTLINQVKMRINELGLANNVKVCTDFLPAEDCIRLLREADLIVFPYQKTGESASSAVRMGIAAGRPVAVAPLPIFEDLAGSVYKLPGSSPAQIAEGLKAWDDLSKAAGSDFKALESSMALYRSAHSLDEVAKFMAREMSVRSATDQWAIELEPKWDDISLLKGRRQADSVVSDEAGIVCYGPYAPLSPGRYRLMVSGEIHGKAPAAKALVTALYGGVTLGEFALADLGEGLLADVILNVTKRLERVEVVFMLGDHTKLRLDGYKFYRRTR